MVFSMYRFVVDAVPQQESEYGSYGKSRIHIWVKHVDIESAKTTMINHIRLHHWIPKEIVSAYLIPQLQTDNLDTQESGLYHRAMQYGIAADFLFWKNDSE